MSKQRWQKPKKPELAGISIAWGGHPPPRWWADKIMSAPTPEEKQAFFDRVPEHLKEMVRTHCYTTRDRRQIAKQRAERRRRYEPWRYR